MKNIVIICVFLFALYGEISCDENVENSSVSEGRTFGHHFLKRISFAMIPASFVVGVITTLLAALTVVSMKSVGIGSILLVLALGQLLARSIPQPQQPFAANSLPIVYSHSRADFNTPTILEKNWK